MEQRGKERGAFSCLELLSTKWVAVSESLTVRSEERGIYTPSENPTVQIYVGSSDTDLGTSDYNRKHCTQRVGSQHMQVSVGTPGKRRDFRRAHVNQTASTAVAGTPGRGQVSVGTPGERREFRRSELPANIGTSDVHRQRASQKHRCRDSWLRSGLPTVGSSDLRRDFRHQKSQKIIICAREVLE